MKKMLFLFLSLLVLPGSLPADTAGRPIRDRVGFCWEKQQMTRMIRLLESIRPLKSPVPADSRIIGGICPHDDYLYAGHLYLPLFGALRAREVVVFGVTHRPVRQKFPQARNRLILDTFSHWQGLDGRPVHVSRLREFLRERLKPENFWVSNPAHAREHSIEALIPFLDHFLDDYRLTPIMVGPMDPSHLEAVSTALARVIGSYLEKHQLVLGRDLVFLISADANHYGPDFDNAPYGVDRAAHQTGTRRDRELIQSHLTGPLTESGIDTLCQALWPSRGGKNFLWCGMYSIPLGIRTIQKLVASKGVRDPIQGRLIAYDDTYSAGVLPLRDPGFGITAPFSLSHWVGFFSLTFQVQKEALSPR